MAPSAELSADLQFRVLPNLNMNLGKHTSSEISRLENICVCFYPVLRKILQYLSGSDAAILLSVIGLFRNPEWQGITKKSVTLLRDIPEHVDWIHQMISKGHTALLIGGDLETWRSRLQYPLTHRRRSPLRLWLAVRVSREVRDERRRREEVRRYDHFLVATDGGVVWGPSREAREARKSGMAFSKTTIIPPPGYAGDLPLPGNDWTSWMKTYVPNENGIDLVWAYTNDMYGDLPLIEMCPTLWYDLQENCQRNGYHYSKIACKRCDPLTPGASFRREKFSRSIFRLPYFDCKRMVYSESHVPAINEHDEIIHPDDLAFALKLDCVPGPTNVMEKIQGISW